MKGNRKKILIGSAAGVVAALVIAYLAGVVYYRGHLLRGTTINGINVSGKTVDQVQDAMKEYRLKVTEKGSDGEKLEDTITAGELGMALTDADKIKQIIREQGCMGWLFKKGGNYTDDKLMAVDDARLAQRIRTLKGFSADETVASQDAHISDYTEGKEYEIVKEVIGNQLDEEKTKTAVKEAVESMKESIDLAKADCYKKPAVTSEDAALKQTLQQMNQCLKAKITYDFDGQQEVVDASLIHDWLKVKNGTVSLKKKKVEEYVANLRRAHDTIYRSRTFKTTSGKTVTINGGDYGWWMNTNGEIAKLTKQILAGKTVTRKPLYLQEAASFGAHDYGDSYVEINLTAQHLYVYQKGEKVLESDFVSGNTSLGNGTPEGVYSLTYKEEMGTLNGENYSTPVSYWMPFNGNIGMHDATWRSQFGGNLYATGGSHGCINLPYKIAQKIYTYVEKGSPVICYKLKGSESSHLTPQTDAQIAQSVIDSINAIGKNPAAKRKRTTFSRTIYNRLNYAQRKLVTNYNKLVKAEQ